MSAQTAVKVDNTSLEVSRTIHAARERVFACFVEKEHYQHWACPTSVHISECDLDGRVGGKFRTVMTSPEGENFIVGGVFQEISPPSRIVYTWAWEQEDGSPGHESLVTVTLTALGKDRTQVNILHTGHENEEAAVKHGEGWPSCLDNMEGYLGR